MQDASSTAPAAEKPAEAAHEQQRWMASAETCAPISPQDSTPLWGSDQFRFLEMHYPRPEPRWEECAGVLAAGLISLWARASMLCAECSGFCTRQAVHAGAVHEWPSPNCCRTAHVPCCCCWPEACMVLV